VAFNPYIYSPFRRELEAVSWHSYRQHLQQRSNHLLRVQQRQKQDGGGFPAVRTREGCDQPGAF